MIDAIGGSGGAEMRQAAAVFNAAQQQGISIGQQYGPGVQYTIDRIGPVFTPEDRIAEITRKQGLIGTCS
jgi:hypothetical protein